MTDSVTIKVDGLQELAAEIRKRGAEAQDALARAVTATALDIRRDVIRRHKKGPKTGRVYRRGKREHQASAPGEAPAVDRGALMSSIYFTQTNRMSATVGSRLAYAYWLEFGSQAVDARPSWIPATEKFRPKLKARAETILRRFAR
jgi:phage gpG-like protein